MLFVILPCAVPSVQCGHAHASRPACECAGSLASSSEDSDLEDDASQHSREDDDTGDHIHHSSGMLPTSKHA